MDSQEFIKLAASAGYEIEEYDNHFCVRGKADIVIVVTIPKVSKLAVQLIKKAKALLGM